MSAIEYSGCLRIGRVPGYPRYRVLSSGSVWSRRGGWLNRPVGPWRRLRTNLHQNGYPCLCLSANGKSRTFYLHTVVLRAFLGPHLEGMQCRHLDGNKWNNRLENLRWGTIEQQHADKRRHGTSPRGSRRSDAKLTESDVVKIRRRAGKYGERRKLAKEFGVSRILISDVANRKVWRHVS